MANEIPYPFSEDHPIFCVQGWRELLGEDESIEAVDAVRHFLVTGETGSGKSRSAVIPLLESALRYPEPKPYAAYKMKCGKRAETRQAFPERA